MVQVTYKFWRIILCLEYICKIHLQPVSNFSLNSVSCSSHYQEIGLHFSVSVPNLSYESATVLLLHIFLFLKSASPQSAKSQRKHSAQRKYSCYASSMILRLWTIFVVSGWLWWPSGVWKQWRLVPYRYCVLGHLQLQCVCPSSILLRVLPAQLDWPDPCLQLRSNELLQILMLYIMLRINWTSIHLQPFARNQAINP